MTVNFINPTKMNDENVPQHATELSAETASKLPKIIKFNDLVRCGDEIWIENNGEVYRLRRTKQGKLILTK